MEPSGLSYPAQIGSLPGQGQSDNLWDKTEDPRDLRALLQLKLVTPFPSGRPQAFSLTPDPLVTGIPLQPLLLGLFSQKSDCTAGSEFSSLLSYSFQKQAHRASFSLQRFIANTEGSRVGMIKLTTRERPQCVGSLFPQFNSPQTSVAGANSPFALKPVILPFNLTLLPSFLKPPPPGPLTANNLLSQL